MPSSVVPSAVVAAPAPPTRLPLRLLLQQTKLSSR